jgi:predicted DNA-binding transcriptional regulator AlpA
MSDQKLAVPAKTAASMLSIGVSTFWRDVKAGKLPAPVKIGGATRWRVCDLERVLEPATAPTTP